MIRRRDPKLKKKGGVYVCVVCGLPLNDLTIAHQDPFCRAKCCHEFYEIDFSQTTASGRTSATGT